MTRPLWTLAAALISLALLSNCGPLIGAAAAIGADKAAEQDGDGGLF